MASDEQEALARLTEVPRPCLLSFVKYCDIQKPETVTLAREKSARVVTILSNYQ